MTISRKQLYAAGEPFGDSATRHKVGGRVYGGGDSSSSNDSAPVTTNTDNRTVYSVANTDYSTNITDSRSSSISDNSIHTDNSNSSDAIVAMSKAGADIIKSSGAAVVDLARFQGAQNTQAWDKTLTTGAKLIDKLMDKTAEGFALSSKVVDSFTPTDNKNADLGKYALIAAAVVAGAVLLKGGK